MGERRVEGAGILYSALLQLSARFPSLYSIISISVRFSNRFHNLPADVCGFKWHLKHGMGGPIGPCF